MSEVRIPSPFPPPDEEICENYGRTMFYAQKLEREFKLVLLAAELLGKIKIDRKEFKSSESFVSRQNLGGLIKVFREVKGLEDKALKKTLYDACDDRNLLAHSFFANIDPEKLSTERKAELLNELGRIRLSVGQAFLIIREFRKLLEEEIGFAEEEIEAELKKADAS
jgi:hypothetical protein